MPAVNGRQRKCSGGYRLEIFRRLIPEPYQSSHHNVLETINESHYAWVRRQTTGSFCDSPGHKPG